MSFPNITQNIGTITETIETTTEAPQVTNPDFDTLAPSSINGQRNAQTEQNTVISQTNTISGQINTLSGQINTAGSYIDNSLQEIEQATNFQGNYDSGTTYSKNQTVLSGGIYYFSLVDSNTGNTPASSPTFWSVKPSNNIFGGNGVDGEVIVKDSSGATQAYINSNGDSSLNGGNVNIGTPSSTTGLLNVGGRLDVKGVTSSTTGYTSFKRTGSLDNIAIIDFLNDSGIVLSVRKNNTVGINEINPTTTLHANGPIRKASYTVSTVPSASSAGAGTDIFVTDETGGAVNAFSDGTNWRRCTDRAIIS